MVGALVLVAFMGIGAGAVEKTKATITECACCGTACACLTCGCNTTAAAGVAATDCDCRSGDGCCELSDVTGGARRSVGRYLICGRGPVPGGTRDRLGSEPEGQTHGSGLQRATCPVPIVRHARRRREPAASMPGFSTGE